MLNLQSRDASALSAREFHQDIVSAGNPVVLRNLAADWPVVAAAKQSPSALADYLLSFDRGQPMRAMVGSPAINGRFFYNDALTGFNFRTESLRLDAALDMLLASADEPSSAALAIQSVPLWNALPGFDQANRNPLLPPSVEPRAWLGNRVTVAAHYDPSENIACVVAGTRRFTLFPPDQAPNLYPGPLEFTPAGPAISMVDFDAPDLAKYPRFETALENALVADLEPGDAVYIPYLWWHHVRSVGLLNLLINYWWAPPSAGTGHALEAFVHALAAIRTLPPVPRRAWQALFDHYVFSDEPIAEHLPESKRGIQGDPPSPESLSWVSRLLGARHAKP